MMKKRTIRNTTMASLVALTVALSACSSSDDDPTPEGEDTTASSEGATEGSTEGATEGSTEGATEGSTEGATEGSTEGATEGSTEGATEGSTEGTTGDGSDLNPNLNTVSVSLDSTITVPPANVDGASGEGSFTVDTETGAISGSVTVMGTSGVPNAAHIHAGEVGDAGPVLITLVGSEDGNTWTVEDGAALDAGGIEQFEAGSLYVNVHTEANPAGELRAQLVDDSTAMPAPGSLTISFRNTSDTMPMTPPVVALHNAPDADNGIRLFEVGQPASEEVIAIAENGENDGLVALATEAANEGRVSAAGVAAPDPAGPLLPGATSSINLDLEGDDQVLSVVSMIVCSNDGFSGIDSRALSADATETFTAPIYDAGSETNVLELNYWVPPCGGEGNLGDEENGSITAHPGQSESENADFDFAADAQLLEITVTRN